MLYWIVQLCILIYIFNTNFARALLVVNSTTEITTVTQRATRKTTTGYPRLANFDYDVFCKFQANGYDCANDNVGLPRFYFDVKMQDCKTFQYGLCHEVAKNVFPTLSKCHEVCGTKGPEPIFHNLTANIYCRMQPDFGECTDYHQMYYYDVTTQKCQGFSFSGCGGNQNRFSNLEICQTVCSKAVEYT